MNEKEIIQQLNDCLLFMKSPVAKELVQRAIDWIESK